MSDEELGQWAQEMSDGIAVPDDEPSIEPSIEPLRPGAGAPARPKPTGDGPDGAVVFAAEDSERAADDALDIFLQRRGA